MIGETISHYKILEKLGEGGMGVVYKAQDTQLDRLVALKFLPSHLSSSSEDKARFIQEAKAAAALSHPNICTIYGVEENDQQTFIAMEYVDGKTLKDVGKSLPLNRGVDIGIQIADGLAAAHERNIVHRDIKPENIMVRNDGRVQIMDFGLAKLKGASRLTKEGSTVGTAGYMSPEQIQGQNTDHRTDIFSLGVILYELFTGQSPFKGVHETAINYEIVNVDPEPMTSLKPEISAELDGLVFECLAKEPSERTQSVAEVAKDLRHFKRDSSRSRMSRVMKASPIVASREGPATVSYPTKWFSLPWLATGFTTLVALLVAALYVFSPPPERQTVRSFIISPEHENFFFYGNFGGPPAISPDGKRVAFVAADSLGRRFLFVRPLNAVAAQRLAGTEGALFPFWSPDNQYIAFESQGSLKKVDASGGAPVTICAVINFRGGSWSPDGIIIFSPLPVEPLVSVPASGGIPAPLTKLSQERRENSHRWPWFLPDRKHFLYFARTVATGAEGEGGAIRVASLDGKTDKLLVHASSNAVYASGHLLYVRENNLVAQRFDDGSLELKGEAIAIAEAVGYDQSVTRALFTASQNGILLYQTGSVQLGSRLTLVDRGGKHLGTVGGLVEYIGLQLSPDGKRVAAAIFDFQSHNNNLWIFDVLRGNKTRFTFNSAYSQSPVWSPDGGRIAYNSNQGGTYNLYVKPSTGAGSEELLLKTETDKAPLDWSPDGKNLLFGERGNAKTRYDLWIMSMQNRTPIPFLQSESDEYDGRFSPDGHWVAYVSNESGQDEVYIKPLQGESGRWQVSLSGGSFPRWRRDGKELFYVDASNRLTAAEIKLSAKTVEVNNVHPLFDVASIAQAGDYDVFPDGKRFLINLIAESQNQTPMTLVVNWDAELKKR